MNSKGAARVSGNNRIGIPLMLCSALCVCVGQLFWKLGAANVMVFLLAGFVLYGTGALLMLCAYKYGSLSVLQPMLSMNYVFTPLLARFVLNETITPMKFAGIVIITISVILIGRADD